jgi:hypothetical protein
MRERGWEVEVRSVGHPHAAIPISPQPPTHVPSFQIKAVGCRSIGSPKALDDDTEPDDDAPLRVEILSDSVVSAQRLVIETFTPVMINDDIPVRVASEQVRIDIEPVRREMMVEIEPLEPLRVDIEPVRRSDFGMEPVRVEIAPLRVEVEPVSVDVEPVRLDIEPPPPPLPPTLRFTSDGKIACALDGCSNSAMTGCPFCFPCCKQSGGDQPPLCENHFSPQAIARRQALNELGRAERAGRRRGGRGTGVKRPLQQ